MKWSRASESENSENQKHLLTCVTGVAGCAKLSRGGSVGKVTKVGIDLAKRTSHLVAVNHRGKVLHKRKFNTEELLSEVKKLGDDFEVILEACGASHHYGRELERHGYQSTLLPAQVVAKYRVKQKNDYNDAYAETEAASRSDVCAVPVKDLERQEAQHLLRVRERVLKEMIALSNQLHGVMLEYGQHTSRGHRRLSAAVSSFLIEGTLSELPARLLREDVEHLELLILRLKSLDREVKKFVERTPLALRMCTVPGVGPVTALSIYAAATNPERFKDSREFTAWLGLVPVQFSTGGETRLGSLPKNGSYPLRRLLIHGARSVMRLSGKKDDTLSLYAARLDAKKTRNKAVVAVANKMARILWRVMVSADDQYDPRHNSGA